MLVFVASFEVSFTEIVFACLACIQGILGKLRSLLLKAVYVEPAAHEPEVSEWDRSAVETYYRLVCWLFGVV
jgi:hypothetical protein